MIRLFDRLIGRALERGPVSTSRSDEPGIAVVETDSSPTSEPTPDPADTVEVGPDRHQSVPTTPVAARPEPIGPDRAAHHVKTTEEERVFEHEIPDVRPRPAERVNETAANPISEPAAEPAAGPPSRADRLDAVGEPRAAPIDGRSTTPGLPPPATTAPAWKGPSPSTGVAARRHEPAPAQPVRRHTAPPTESPRPTPAVPIQGPAIASSSPPVEENTEVNVTIGRIEVSTPGPQQPAPPAARVPPPPPVHLTLSDYMARRNPHEQ